MNFRFIYCDFKMSVKGWLRSKGTVFWTILFPILLILIFGAIFSNTDDVQYSLVVQNLDVDDESGFSEGFLENLSSITVFDIQEIGVNEDISEYMGDNDIAAGLVIPNGFGDDINSYILSKYSPTITFDDSELPFNLTMYVDPTEQTTTIVLKNIIVSVIYELNIGITGGEKVIGLDEEKTIGEDYNYIDFFVPGMIGFTIMTSMIYGSIERNTKFRKDGILRKLLTMPISRADWIISKMIFMLFLSFISTFVILVVGVGVWGLSIHINIFFFILIIAASFLFSGMGMLISRFVKEEETADMAGGAITFPMMFLAGTFFPLEMMPDFLQSIARILPLYYVNEGLRNAMIKLDFDQTLYFTGFVLAFALIFFIMGVFLTKWDEN